MIELGDAAQPVAQVQFAQHGGDHVEFSVVG